MKKGSWAFKVSDFLNNAIALSNLTPLYNGSVMAMDAGTEGASSQTAKLNWSITYMELYNGTNRIPLVSAARPLAALSIAPPVPAASAFAASGGTQLSDSGASGGVPPYTYQWLEEAPSGASYSAIPSANSLSYNFQTNYSSAPGQYLFKLQATDLETPAKTINSSQVAVMVQGQPSPPTVSVPNANLVTVSNASANISRLCNGSWAMDFPGENLSVELTSRDGCILLGKFSIENATATSPPPPDSLSKLIAYQINLTAGTMNTINTTINVSIHYPCDLNGKGPAPYILNNGIWVRIASYSVDTASCTMEFAVPSDPVIGIFTNGGTAPYTAAQAAVIVIILAAAAAYLARAAANTRRKTGRR
jgi:hypothetical protein